MKLTTRGFTLVELMIVIAIIGILAAALFPSLTAYLARGRDTSRVSGIKEIVTGIAGYQLDKIALPPDQANTGAAAGVGACVNSGSLKAYIAKFPLDPVAGRTSNCETTLMYGYGTGTDAGGTATFVVSAAFENANGGNTGGSIAELKSYQGNGHVQGGLVTVDSLKKGTGSGYIIRN